jgi:tRNA-splicing ligase RtcB
MGMSELRCTQIGECRWEIPKHGGMRVPGRLYANEAIMAHLKKDRACQQVANVAQLPGIVSYSLAMPDIHWGYGFPIGGVAAFDLDAGVISPGGVGYDINCGVRLMRTALGRAEVEPGIEKVLQSLYGSVPAGVGSRSSLRLKPRDEEDVLVNGAGWAVRKGLGTKQDLERIEEAGCLAGARPETVGRRALERGRPQLGTLGSGNHFIEVGYVEEVYDVDLAATLGLEKGRITITVHTGSRGFGHQVCDDYIKKLLKASHKYGFTLPDRQLCCAPFKSREGQDYFAAMACAVNYAFANRQVVSWWAGNAVARALNTSREAAGIETVYEVAHNIAKVETHTVGDAELDLCVHRKGATRAFGPGHPDLPSEYRAAGQPVLIPGDMGRYSYVLVGTQKAMEETFGSTCHGAGRLLSRHEALRRTRGRSIRDELARQGVAVMSASTKTLAEEVPEAYKDVSDVVETVHQAGISRKVVRLRPLCVVKG